MKRYTCERRTEEKETTIERNGIERKKERERERIRESER